MRTETLDRINDLLQKSTNVALKIIYDDKLIDTNIKKKKNLQKILVRRQISVLTRSIFS